MAAGSSIFDQAVLSLLLTNTTANLTGIGDAAGLQPSLTAGTLYVSLHSASPGKGGTQSTNELGFTGYTRIGVSRAATSWQVTAGGAAYPGTGYNLAAITYPVMTGAPAVTAAYAALGTSPSGTGYLLLIAPLTAAVVLTANVIALFPSASLFFTAD